MIHGIVRDGIFFAGRVFVNNLRVTFQPLLSRSYGLANKGKRL
jgi:hypothetical protein